MTDSMPDDDETVDVTPEMLAEIRAAAALNNLQSKQPADENATFDVFAEPMAETQLAETGLAEAGPTLAMAARLALDEDATIDVTPAELAEASRLGALKRAGMADIRTDPEPEEAQLAALPPPPTSRAKPIAQPPGVNAPEKWRAPARLQSDTHLRPEEIAVDRPLQRRVSAKVAVLAIGLTVVLSFGVAAWIFGGSAGDSDELPPDETEQIESSVGG